MMNGRPFTRGRTAWINKAAQLLFVAIGCLLLCGCVSQVSVKSNKAVQFQSQVKRLFVVANLGPALETRSGDLPRTFASLIVGNLDQCGTQTKAFVQQQGLSLSLDDSGADNIKKAIAELKPDSLLDISWRTVRSSTRGPSMTVYLLQLRSAQTKSVVWKAEVDLVQKWYPAEALAGAIIGRMKQDGLIAPSCVAPEPESPILHLNKV